MCRVARGQGTSGLWGDRLRRAIVFLPMMAFFLPGCSEEKPPETAPPKVVMPIQRPRQDAPPSPAQKAVESREASAPAARSQTKDERRPPTVAPAAAQTERETDVSVEKGEARYRTQEGDTLSGISGLTEVYGDPDKWASLFRYNMDRLPWTDAAADAPHRDLPGGLVLRYVTPEGASERVRALGSKVWVVNVFSSRDPGQITPLAVTLMRKGYPAYSTRATVKGSEWTRLRVGFFKDKNEAEKAAQRITAILGGVATTWVVRIGQDELERFGGY